MKKVLLMALRLLGIPKMCLILHWSHRGRKQNKIMEMGLNMHLIDYLVSIQSCINNDEGDAFNGIAQTASNEEGDAFDAFGSSDQFNSNNANDGFEASIGENAFEAFDEADSGNDKGFQIKARIARKMMMDSTSQTIRLLKTMPFRTSLAPTVTTALVMLRTHSLQPAMLLPRETNISEYSRHWRSSHEYFDTWMMKMSLMTHLVLFQLT